MISILNIDTILLLQMHFSAVLHIKKCQVLKAVSQKNK